MEGRLKNQRHKKTHTRRKENGWSSRLLWLEMKQKRWEIKTGISENIKNDLLRLFTSFSVIQVEAAFLP